jgi:hypothetical protein
MSHSKQFYINKDSTLKKSPCVLWKFNKSVTDGLDMGK